MASTEEILKAAADLGKLVATHSSARQLDSAGKRLQEDLEAQRMLTDYNRHMMEISRKESEGRAIEVEDKRKLERLQSQVIQNPVLRQYQMAQMDYLDLMRRVDEAIAGGPPGQPSGAASAESPLVNPDALGR